eukprot:793000-Rhodomonas_salina.1
MHVGWAEWDQATSDEQSVIPGKGGCGEGLIPRGGSARHCGWLQSAGKGPGIRETLECYAQDISHAVRKRLERKEGLPGCCSTSAPRRAGIASDTAPEATSDMVVTPPSTLKPTTNNLQTPPSTLNKLSTPPNPSPSGTSTHGWRESQPWRVSVQDLVPPHPISHYRAFHSARVDTGTTISYTSLPGIA